MQHEVLAKAGHSVFGEVQLTVISSLSSYSIRGERVSRSHQSLFQHAFLQEYMGALQKNLTLIKLHF